MSAKSYNPSDIQDSNEVIPNWRSLGEYPNPKTTTTQEWAWEFLRRNNEYRKDFNELKRKLIALGYFEIGSFQNTSEDDSEGLHKKVEEVWRKANAYAFPIMFKYEIRAYPPFFVPPPDQSCKEVDFLWTTVLDRSAKIFIYPNRSGQDIPLEDGSYELTELNFGHIGSYDPKRWMDKNECEQNQSQEVRFLMNPRKLYVGISLEENISYQIDQLKKIATKQQEQLQKWGIGISKGRKESSLYRDYLRCLDAEETGAGKKEIVECLIPDEPNEYPSYNANKKINNWLIRAKEIRDRDYIKLSKL